MVSVKEPIWFTFTRIELAVFVSMPRCKRFTLVTNRSSPTNCTLSPILSLNIFEPVQSSSASPSSMDRIGYFFVQSAQKSTISEGFNFSPLDFLKWYTFSFRGKIREEPQSREWKYSSPG